MPYIKKERRARFNGLAARLAQQVETPGDLNYVVTMLCHLRLKELGVNYTNLNEIVGVLECAKAEIQRRLVGPYEDKKIEANGDLEVLDG